MKGSRVWARHSSARRLWSRTSTSPRRRICWARTRAASTGIRATWSVTSAFGARAWKHAAIPRSTSRYGILLARRAGSLSTSSSGVSAATRLAFTTPVPDTATSASGPCERSITGDCRSQVRRGPYEDLDAFLNRADELALSLVEEGYTGMKIWPFDAYAHASDGMYISPSDLDRALEPFRKIRRAVGNKIDIMVEFHSLWNLTAANGIAHALEQFEPFWYEDPVRVDGLTALAEFARRTRVPVCSSELLASRWGFRDLLAQVPVGVVMFDLCWVGGLSEGRKIAAMAEAWHLPVAPHDCVGPVTLTANVHLAVNAPNALIQEIVRASFFSWYRELVTDLPKVERGYIYPLQGPGLGTRLQPGVEKRKDATVRTTVARGARVAR